MKAATALKLNKFADATVYFAHCVAAQNNLDRFTAEAAQESKASQDLDDALLNLKASKVGLFEALELEDLTP